MMRIRPAVERDVDALVDIHGLARATYYRGVVPAEQLTGGAAQAELRDAYASGIGSTRRILRCAEIDSETVGFLALGPPFEPVIDADPATVGQLFGLYVRPVSWGLGVGGGLHAEAVRIWRQSGITTARLEVWAGNERARAFYARRGWQPDGHRRPGPADVDFVRLTLSPTEP